MPPAAVDGAGGGTRLFASAPLEARRIVQPVVSPA
jgi:hypothetical protein